MPSKVGLTLLLAVSSFAQGSSTFKFIEKPGPHPVGLKVVEQYDYSRVYQRTTDDLGHSFQGERARPLQTLICTPPAKPALNR